MFQGGKGKSQLGVSVAGLMSLCRGDGWPEMVGLEALPGEFAASYLVKLAFPLENHMLSHSRACPPVPFATGGVSWLQWAV